MQKKQLRTPAFKIFSKTFRDSFTLSLLMLTGIGRINPPDTSAKSYNFLRMWLILICDNNKAIQSSDWHFVLPTRRPLWLWIRKHCSGRTHKSSFHHAKVKVQILPSSSYFFTARTGKWNHPLLRIFCNNLAQQESLQMDFQPYL